MKIKLTIIALLLLNIAFAQNYKFGKISKEELMETSNQDDPDAHATVLYKKHNVSFDYREDDGFVQQNEYHERIKIYDKQGFEWANKRFRLYDRSNSSKEELNDLKAYTYTLENGKIEKTKLKKEGIFEEKNNKYWSTTTLTMPNVKEGCIIEMKYIIESQFMQIDDVVLQYDIPIKKLEVDVVIPEYFNFKKIVNPKAVFYPKFEEYTNNRKETITSKSRSGQFASQTTFQSSDFEFKENGFKVYMDNIPALSNEPLVDNRDNYRSKIALEYEYYRGPNGQLKYYSTNWEKVTKNIFDSDGFGGQLDRQNYYKDEVNTLLNGVEDPMEKAALIYNFVKNKVKWNGFIGYTSEKGVKKAYKEGVGNVADINLMLTSMLKYAGLSANPVLISTRDNGIPIVPSTSGFNYVIAAIELKDNLILLDASSKYAIPNILPERILNWQGRIIRERGSSAWVSLATGKKSKEVNSINFNIESDLSINGKVRTQLTNHLALEYRNLYTNASEESTIKRLERGNDGVEISNLKISNIDKIGKPVMFSYDFELESAVEEIGGNLYLSPLLFLTVEENIFKQETRQFPIDFIHPITDKYSVNIKLPEGYIVESIPENAKVEFNTNEAKFSYITKKNGESSIQLIINLDINRTLVFPSDYNVFKQFFQFLVDKQSEKIVLKKA
ncbi:DUF3857 domain-containing protein [uncultured Lacinutrix sp.]|uniref:DUF3857 domain-containing protein n=1 Tax=uncultured Lacinutrix sp. TaxID=574032 RepID=UPI00262E688D|nr:DUF3857 domain-containing protein [uncultured Lacinutrix sp.]